MQAQVEANGLVTIVHSPTTLPHLIPNGKHGFKVSWSELGAYPRVSVANCGNGCVPHGVTCLCDAEISTSAVFTGNTNIPSMPQLRDSLHIGSFPPETFGSEYTLCTSELCTSQDNVEVYLSGLELDASTIFKTTINSKVVYLANKVSTVHISDYSFRNPPHFMSFSEGTKLQAEQETEAVIDHLLNHPNTAPFISHLLIQRFVTSNP